MGVAEMTHELKIHPEYFEAVRNGDKTFHLCQGDREYKVGDTLILCSHGKRRDLVVKLKATVTYIQEVYVEGEYFLPVPYKILALKVEK
jgi:ASC-1-like (ASCH) protein